MKSPKESSIEKRIISVCGDDPALRMLISKLLEDKELHELQEYANTVSIRRLGFNDHGPVHMRQAALNSLLMLDLLKKSGVKTSLENDESGTFSDSRCAVFLASFLHDIGMSVGRQNHENMSCMLGMPIVERMLNEVFPDDIHKRVVIRSTVLEGISGHMANHHIYSIEAGIILVADGCDMERGRARIPMLMNTEPRTGDIHKYSANSIGRVRINEGEVKPILIDVTMDADVGFFQIEEVLLPKINSSTIKPYIEVHAGLTGQPRKKYL